MANEIRKSIRLSIDNGVDSDSFGGETVLSTQETATPAVRAQSLTLQATTADTAMTFGGMAAGNYGEALIENLSTTAGQIVTIGPDNGSGAIKPAFYIYPGKQASVQLIPSVTYRMQAAAGSPLLAITILAK